MNIFFLSENATEAAQAQCNRHVVKMIVESAQLLSTCYVSDKYYRHTHFNHPCAKWVRESKTNYLWLLSHGLALCNEYTFRYNRNHATARILIKMACNMPYIEDIGLTPPALAMPDEFKIYPYNPVLSYRAYYRYKQRTIDFRYTRRQMPDWLFSH